MRALCWRGVNDLAVETVPDPRIVNPHDAILRVGLSTTCGSDLHLIDGLIPTMSEGDVIGHEFMGEIVEVGPAVEHRQVGDRVVVPSFIGCGACEWCRRDEWSLCDNTNPHPDLQHPLFGAATAGIYGYSHAFGGYAGSHAQYVRVPFADHGCFVVPDGVADEQAVFISDAAPTGYMGADLCGLRGGETVAVWGAGGVGAMAARAALLLGAERVISIDSVPERLDLARCQGAETLDHTAVDSVVEALLDLTGGRGPDACIEAVGMEATGSGLDAAYDKVKQALRLETDRATSLRQSLAAVRKGGTVSVLGVFGVLDKWPMGLVVNKGLTLRSAQQHGQAYVPRLLEHVARGELDPAPLATHRMPLEDAVRGYQLFKDKEDGCIRAVFDPAA